MNNRLLTWAPIGILFLLAAVTWWLDSQVQPPQPKRDGSSRHDPDYIVNDFTATRMGKDGAPRYILRAKKMVHYPDDDSTELEFPDFRHVEGSKPELRIVADKGQLSSGGEDAYFISNVRVSRAPDAQYGELKLVTSFLHVIPDKDLVTTDKPVTLTSPHTIINAVGLELNSNTRELKLLSNVKGLYENPK